MNARRCTKCGETKPVKEFYADARRADGCRPHCKMCMRSAQRVRPASKRTAAQRADYRRRRGQVRAPYLSMAEIRSRAAEKRSKIARQQREAVIRAPRLTRGSREWYAVATESEVAAYRVLAREYFRSKYPSIKSDEVERVARYKRLHRERCVQWGSTRIRRIAQQSVRSISADELADLKRDTQVCAYCGDPFTRSERTIDHVVPVCRGGAHTLDNIVVACRACNESKGIKSLEDWRKSNASTSR